MRRGRLVAAGAGAVALVAAVTVLRAEAPAPETIVTPDGQQLRAYHDPALITPPSRPEAPPRPPAELRVDERADGALVTWPKAPFGAELRWGRAGSALDNVSYHTAFGTTLRGLETGRYRVEVRSVDGAGQRSAPVTGEFDVTGEPPQWQRGLGFTADFTTDPTPDARHWRLSDQERECLRRTEAPHTTLLIRSECRYFELQPASQLTLGEPDSQGISGRVVVVTDAPLTEQTDAELSIVASSSPASTLAFLNPAALGGSVRQNESLPSDAVALRVSSAGPALEFGAAISPPPLDVVEHHAPTTGVASPGALHRWELIFKTGRVEVLRNGEPVAVLPVTVPWRQAHLSIASGRLLFGETSTQTPARIAFVGFTSPPPDPRPVRVHNLDAGGTVVRTAGAVAARVIVLVRASVPLPNPLQAEVQAPPGQPSVTVALQPVASGDSTAYTADLPATLLTGELWFRLRLPDDDAYFVRLVLELTQPEGTVDIEDLEVLTLPPPAEPKPLLLVHSPETSSVLSNGERTKAAEHRVLLRVDGVSDAASMMPWIAVQVDLGDRRILTLPTAAAGPAIAAQYEFTLDLSGMPDGVHRLSARLVPDRPGVRPNVTELSLRLGR